MQVLNIGRFFGTDGGEGRLPKLPNVIPHQIFWLCCYSSFTAKKRVTDGVKNSEKITSSPYGYPHRNKP